jgi:pimeloyl-ACP methyl ester carboxylesterase
VSEGDPPRRSPHRLFPIAGLWSLVPVVALSTTACVRATLRPIAPADTGVKQHAIFVDHDGRALRPRVDSGSALMDSTAYGAYLHHMLDGVRTSGKHRVLLWIHGGLVELKEGLELTQRVVRDVGTDSTQRDVYPIAINWESTLAGAYREHLVSLRQGERETRPLAIVLTTPLYFIADLGRAITRAPIVWYGQASRFLERDHPSRVRDAEARLTTAMDSVLVPATGEHVGAIAISIGKYKEAPLDGFFRYATLPFIPFKMIGTFAIDGAGTPGWEVMRRRTKTMYRSTGEWRAVDSTAHFLRPTGAVSVFLDSLAALAASDSAHHYDITMIGHSMGTIVASEAIRTHPRLPLSTIVFMAGAATIREFEIGVLPYLENHRATRFYNLTLHPIAERREHYLAHLAPDGSLLEWIDGYIASPETELDRVIGKWDNVVMATGIFPDSVRGQIQLKAFGYRDGVGYGTNDREPHRHGDFDDPGVPFWRCDFWQPPPTEALCRANASARDRPAQQKRE